jgi:hypothetical protein
MISHPGISFLRILPCPALFSELALSGPNGLRGRREHGAEQQSQRTIQKSNELSIGDEGLSIDPFLVQIDSFHNPWEEIM